MEREHPARNGCFLRPTAFMPTHRSGKASLPNGKLCGQDARAPQFYPSG
ncbi:MAG TPA: hypothetical protein VGO50_10485 [Pyrinomonadaceae bacterium]|nr:hypothetical protein [Pyrinomonadaceae bacterium]